MKWEEVVDDYFEKLGFVKGQYFSDQQRAYYASSLSRGKYSIAIFSFLAKRKDLKNLKMFEPGCGVGSFALLASKQGAFAVGCDTRKDILKLGRALNRIEKGEAHFVVADCLHMPFKENFFDYAFLWDVLEHTTEQEKMLQEVFLTLSYRGVLLSKISNRMFPVEPHTLLPFLSYLPKSKADFFVKKFRNGFYLWYDSYEKEIQLPTYNTAKKWFEDLDDVKFYNMFLHYLPYVGEFSLKHNIMSFKLPKILKKLFSSRAFLSIVSKWPFIVFAKDWIVVAKKS